MRRALVSLVVATCGGWLACARPSAGVAGFAPEARRGEARSIVPDVPEDRGYVAVVAARDSLDLAPRIEGELVRLHVVTGDHVSRGDLVAELDTAPAREALAVAQAEIRTATALLDRAAVEVADSERELELALKLVADKTLSAKRADDARFAHLQAEANHRHSAALVSEAEARAARLARTVERAQLLAPFEGTIATRYESVGAMVGPGAPVIRLISDGLLVVKFAMPADAGARVEVGDRVETSVDGLEAALDATVSELSPEVDSASRMVFVEATLAASEDEQARLRSGLDAWVRIPSK